MKISIDRDSFSDRGAKPSVRELLSSVEFNPHKGTIDLNGARIVMQRANVGHVMRQELREVLGEEETRIFLMRQGYLTGKADAHFVRENWPHLNIGDAFTAGTRLHTFTGTVRVETVHNDFDFKRGRFAGEFLWHDSVEAEQIAQNGLQSKEPCCWTLVGYASGYASAFFGKPILYKEISCIAQGKKVCRVSGKPIDEWKADDPDVIRFRDKVIPRERVRNADATRVTGRTSDEDLVNAPVSDAVTLRITARLPCILSGPDDSGRRRALAALASPGTPEPNWYEGGSLTIQMIDAAHPTVKKPLLINRIEQCAADVQNRLAQGRIPFHGVTHLTPRQIQAEQRLETTFFHLLTVGTVTMPGFRSRPAAARQQIIAQVAKEVARATGQPVPDSDTLAALDRTGAITGFSQLTGVLRHIMLVDKNPTTAIDALTRPTQQSLDDHRLFTLIDDALAKGTLDLNALERLVRNTALAREDGNLSAAARRLGLSRAQLAYRMKADQEAN